MSVAIADDGRERFLQLLEMLPMADPRTDIDTASLVARFPHLDGVDVRDVVFEGPHGEVQGRVYQGDEQTGTGLVWVHGGAFVSGGLDMPESHWVGMELAARGIRVVALDYRKALDGVHHPVPSDDVLAGWLAATADPDLFGPSITRVHLGGASAGANLSAGIALRLQEDGSPLPASLLLFYPVLHSTIPAASAAAAAAVSDIDASLRFSPEFMRAVNLNYAGDAAKLEDPVAFPANGDPVGLPPTLIVNAEADDLRPSGEAFAAQLQHAGVVVEADFEPGTVHGFLDVPGLPAGVAGVERIVEWVSRSI